MTTVGSRVVVNASIAGALVGGAFSVAKNMRDCKEQAITNEQAVSNILRDTAGSGVATAAGVFTAGAIGCTGVGAVLVTIGAMAGAKYYWDNLANNK